MVNPALENLKSFNASGQINKQYVYFSSYGKQRVRAYVVPANPRTPRQESKRGFFIHGMEYWNNLSESEKEFYNVKSKKIKTAWIGYNYFMRLWLRGDIVQECTRSIQRGNLGCVDGINNITISPVVMAKSVVWVSTYAFGSSEGLAKSNGIKGGELTSTTNLVINAIKGVAADSPVAYWQVVEYY